MALWIHIASLAQVTIEQFVKDYFQCQLGENDSFSQSEKEIDKNASVTWMVVKFAHFTKKSLRKCKNNNFSSNGFNA